MCIGIYVNCPLLLLNFNDTWIFSTYYLKMLKCEILWKSVLLEPSFSVWTEEVTDRFDKLIDAFHNFANTSRNFGESDMYKTRNF
jgi:hypothetical protein